MKGPLEHVQPCIMVVIVRGCYCSKLEGPYLLVLSCQWMVAPSNVISLAGCRVIGALRLNIAGFQTFHFLQMVPTLWKDCGIRSL